MAILDLHGNPQIRYGTMLYISHDTIRGLRINSIYRTDYGLDSATYTLHYNHITQLMDIIIQRDNGTVNTISDIDPLSGTVTGGGSIINWTITTVNINVLGSGYIRAHVARSTGDYLGYGTQDVDLYGYREITTDSSARINVANASIRKSGGTWGSYVDPTPGEVLELRINNYPDIGRKWVSIIQGNTRYQTGIIVTDPSKADNVKYDVLVAPSTHESWDAAVANGGILGSLDEDINISGFPVNGDLRLWIRATDEETGSKSFQQYHTATFSRVVNSLLPDPIIRSVNTEDGRLKVTVGHPYSTYKMIYLTYNGNTRSVPHTKSSVTVDMGSIPYGYTKSLSLYVRELSTGYKSNTISTNISGYWVSTVSPLRHIELYDGVMGTVPTHLEDIKSYLNGRVMVGATADGIGSITLDTLPVITANDTGLIVPNITIDTSITSDLVDSKDGPFGLTDNTLYFLDVNGNIIGKYDGTHLKVIGVFDSNTMSIPLRDVLVYKTESEYIFFRDHREYFIQFATTGIITQEEIMGLPTSFNDYTNGNFKISQSGNNVDWTWNNSPLVSVDVDTKIISTTCTLQAVDVIMNINATAPVFISGDYIYFINNQQVILWINPVTQIICLCGTHTRLEAGTDIYMESMGGNQYIIVSGDIIYFNGLISGIPATYMTLSSPNNNNYLSTPYQIEAL